jgi:hypothetical protein
MPSPSRAERGRDERSAGRGRVDGGSLLSRLKAGWHDPVRRGGRYSRAGRFHAGLFHKTRPPRMRRPQEPGSAGPQVRPLQRSAGLGDAIRDAPELSCHTPKTPIAGETPKRSTSSTKSSGGAFRVRGGHESYARMARPCLDLRTTARGPGLADAFSSALSPRLHGQRALWHAGPSLRRRGAGRARGDQCPVMSDRSGE